jgi:hypothetical protein
LGAHVFHLFEEHFMSKIAQRHAVQRPYEMNTLCQQSQCNKNNNNNNNNNNNYNNNNSARETNPTLRIPLTSTPTIR